MRKGFSFSTRIKVRYAEIDGQKIVFNSRYLEYVDVAVTEFWPRTGIEALPEWRHTEFNVRHTEIDYLKPFRFGDEIEIFMAITRIGGTSLTQRFDLCHALTARAALHGRNGDRQRRSGHRSPCSTSPAGAHGAGRAGLLVIRRQPKPFALSLSKGVSETCFDKLSTNG